MGNFFISAPPKVSRFGKLFSNAKIWNYHNLQTKNKLFLKKISKKMIFPLPYPSNCSPHLVFFIAYSPTLSSSCLPLLYFSYIFSHHLTFLFVSFFTWGVLFLLHISVLTEDSYNTTTFFYNSELSILLYLEIQINYNTENPK